MVFLEMIKLNRLVNYVLVLVSPLLDLCNIFLGIFYFLLLRSPPLGWCASISTGGLSLTRVLDHIDLISIIWHVGIEVVDILISRQFEIQLGLSIINHLLGRLFG
jgi:hypothetical protein